MTWNGGSSKRHPSVLALTLVSSQSSRRQLLRLGVTLLLALVSVALIAAPSLAEANPSPTEQSYLVRLPGHVLAAINKAKRVQSPPNAGKQPITLTLVLKRDHEKAFQLYLHDIYDPHSPNYRHFLTQSEIAARFGPSQKSYDAVLAYLEGHGFKLTEGSNNRMTITARGTRGEAEHTFQTEIGDYQIGARSFYANDQDPALPADLASSVQAVVGLANLSAPEGAMFEIQSEAILRDLFTLAELIDAEAAYIANAKFYPTGGVIGGALQLLPGGYRAGRFVIQMAIDNVFAGLSAREVLSAVVAGLGVPRNALVDSPPDGTGQKIGLVAFSSFQMSDVADWLTLAGLSATLLSQVSKVDVGGGAPLQPGTPGESDVLLGIEGALSTAPGAQVVVYDGPSTGTGVGFEAIFNKMITDGVNVISNSFIYCEDQTTAADVQAVDQVLANAAASGISAFSATGDYGSACSDGSPSTVAVPTDSPHITAVGASSLSFGPGATYDGETWLDESSQIPPGGQSGFGTSSFFSRPVYQDALNTSPMRSVPDVVAPANSGVGLTICEADAGGCPNGSTYGGTSLATPMWAGIVATINEAAGHPLGFLNPLLYSPAVANSNSFHSATNMSTDTAHVGLGSPNADLLMLSLTNQSAGLPDASTSTVTTMLSSPYLPFAGTIPDDGSTAGVVVVQLTDANLNIIPDKTVSLSAAGSNASISPPSVTSVINGTATFTVTDSTLEDVTLTAKTSDGLTLAQQPVIHFIAPPATLSLISEGPSSSLPADGSTAAMITITLTDSLHRPTPGKLVTLSQGGGHSVITGPNPSVTDGNGKIVFTATDQDAEIVNYAGVDVSDGSQAVGNVAVTYTNASANGCPLSVLENAPGSQFTYTNYAWGFPVVSPNCLNPAGMAFDSSGDLYVSEYDGNDSGLYKIPPGGGSASGLRLNATAYPNLTNASGLAFSKDGTQLYMARQSPLGAVGDDGDIVQVSTTDGSIIRTIATLDCATGLATDPISGDLFSDSPCGSPTAGPYIFRISNPESATPGAPTEYAPGNGAQTLWFTPGGTLYAVVTNPGDGKRWIATYAGTNAASPGAVTYIAPAPGNFGAVPDASNQDSPSFIFTDETEGTAGGLDIGGYDVVDLTQNTPNAFNILSNGSTNIYMIIGPDGCYYATQTDRIVRVAGADGSCNFTASSLLARLSLSPESSTPTLGTSQALTVTFDNPIPPAGTQVFLTVLGPNYQGLGAKTDASGQASFRYTGILAGTDNVFAFATVNKASVASNSVQVTWQPGQDTTYLSLNLSPNTAISGQPVTVTASLSDLSQSPPTVISGQTVNFTLGSGSCSATTNPKGIASCSITPSGSGTEALSATFAGTSSVVASNASTGFTVVKPTACTGPLISARLLSGNPNPPAGSSGSWTFQIAICPSQNLTRVSAQGGTDNWTTVNSTSVSAGSLSIRKLNKNNEVLLWTLGNMSASTGQTLSVTLSGIVSAHCGTVQYLDGPWSALYTVGGTPMQSAYTNQIAIASTCK